MIVHDLISNAIPELSPTDGIVNALNLMDEYRVSHLPVVHDGKLLGIVCEEELELLDARHKSSISESQELMDIHCEANKHIFDAVKMFSENDLTILPITGKEMEYLGCVRLEDMIDYIAKIQAVDEPGGIIVLEMNSRDYSMQQIGGIVEGNNAKILSSNITSFADSMKIEVTLKVNTENIAPIIQTFERYDYHIKASYQESAVNEDLKDRYDEFMNYLNI